MTIQEERIKVLEMVREGKITPEEASQLLEALEGSTISSNQAKPANGSIPYDKKGRILRVKVTDSDSSKVRVDVRLPIGVVNAGIKAGVKFAPEIEGVNLDELMEFIKSGEIGKFVDVYDEEDGEHVEVSIE